MPTGAAPIDDKDLKIPRAVKAQADIASELHKQAYTPGIPAETPPASDPAPEPAQTPPAASDPAPELASAPPAATSDGNQEPHGGWEHAYKSMKGRYESSKATAQQLVDSVRMLTDRNVELENQVATLRSATRVADHIPASDPAPAATTLITPKEVEDYGADFLGVVGKKAQEVISQHLAPLQGQLAEISTGLKSINQKSAMSAREEMKHALAQKIPEWEQINHSAEFHEWLALRDPLSGAIRHELLKQAWGRNDTARVLAAFQGFLAKEATGTPQNQQPDLPSGKIPLESFAAPGRAQPAAATNPTPAEKPIHKRSELTTFYAEVAAGRWRGRDKEKAARELELHTAMREGRLR